MGASSCLAWLLMSTCLAWPLLTGTAGDPLAARLQSLAFLNKGTVRATDSFSRLTQCNGFSECLVAWTCAGVRDYLYDTTQQSRPKPPPVGMRSAVPLGGLGTGTFELRADGSFADWQLENQGPALATNEVQNSKLPKLAGAVLGVKVGPFATSLQTHPEAGLPAAEALAYSGAYPFSRHRLNDSRVPAGMSVELYSYSAFELYNENASALPAVAFTLVLRNTGSEQTDASFLLALPLASTASTSRRSSDNTTVVKTVAAASTPAACLKACDAEPLCSYWDWHLLGPGPGCTLHRGAPAVQQYLPNQTVCSGVKGIWQKEFTTAGGSPQLRHTRANVLYDNASTMDPAAALGDYTLLAGAGATEVTVSTGDTAGEIWQDFAQDGVLQAAVASAAGSGAIAARATVPAGGSKSLTLVFGWRFPNRNYVGEELGNQYAEIYSSSAVAAASMASRSLQIATEGASFHQLFTNSSYPCWFSDFLINSLATQPKMGIWVTKQCPKCNPTLVNGHLPGSTANGRYRTYEAFSGCDLDPVHVSDYHQIPYASFYPSLTKNLIYTGWAEMQRADTGMIQEVLGSMGAAGRITGPMDESAGGRTMSDTTTIFILDTLQVYLNTADLAFVKALWPHLVRAAQWQIARTLEGSGFPHHLQNTYDYLGLDKYPNAAYSGFTHMAAMRAIVKLADAVGDKSELSANATASELLCAATMNASLWTGTHWRAAAPWPHKDAIMSGTLHGQSWSNLLGLGLLAPREQLLSHIRMEVETNCAYDKTGQCVLGQQTLPQAPAQASWALDGSPSMNFDTAANAMWVGGEGFDGTSVVGAKAVIALYHAKKNDLWDWKDLHMGPDGKKCGLTDRPQGPALAGEPFVNAHYARQLQGWMVQRAATGQMFDAPAKTLSFKPPLSLATAGSKLPWFTGSAAGMLILGTKQSAGEVSNRAPHQILVTLGSLPKGLNVSVRVSSWQSEVVLDRELLPGEIATLA